MLYCHLYFIDLLLKLQGKFNGCQGSGPLVDSRRFDLLQNDTATPQVLVLDEFLGMLILLFS